ncbi:MAG: hypothetical protein ACJ8EY_03985 [Sphingomicrobium sp.]
MFREELRLQPIGAGLELLLGLDGLAVAAGHVLRNAGAHSSLFPADLLIQLSNL